jgi:hypothetical protein
MPLFMLLLFNKLKNMIFRLVFGFDTVAVHF